MLHCHKYTDSFLRTLFPKGLQQSQPPILLSMMYFGKGLADVWSPVCLVFNRTDGSNIMHGTDKRLEDALLFSFWLSVNNVSVASCKGNS